MAIPLHKPNELTALSEGDGDMYFHIYIHMYRGMHATLTMLLQLQAPAFSSATATPVFPAILRGERLKVQATGRRVHVLSVLAATLALAKLSIYI